MVKKEEGKCEKLMWYDEKRCSVFPTCNSCDFRTLPFRKDEILKQIDMERKNLLDLQSKRKEAEESKIKNQYEGAIIDKVQGISIMQGMLIKHFGFGAMSAKDIIKGMREVRRYKKLLKS